MSDPLAGLTEEVSEDDYEEGEILDEDSLYDDVSSSEEFTSSPENIEPKKNDDKEARGRKRKEHLCKDESLCRNERSGKHCYARIKRRRTSIESNEKPRNIDEKKIKERNLPRPWKKHDKHDIKEKEISKAFQFKEKRRQERGYDRNRLKYRSPSPKLHHVHSAKAAKTSLLKRLVGSGSVIAKVSNEEETDRNPDVDVKPKGEDPDEWNLRIEALKTALMKKFASKKKNGTTAKTKSLEDSIMEYAFNDLTESGNENTPKDVDYRKPCLELESFNESIFKERKTILFSDTDVDCRTFTYYPYVFDKILSPKEDLAVVPNGERSKSSEKENDTLKRKNGFSELEVKKPKIEAEDKDEEELRELALMSVKPKPKDELLKPLHIDTQLPCDHPEKMTSNNSGSDPWDDVDEDILRAQLLSSLSAKIPSEYVEPEPPTPKKPLKKVIKKTIKKPVKKSIKNRSIVLDNFVNKRFVKKNNQTRAPAMKKMIIKVDDSDSSDIESPVKPDLSASIDLLLQEVRNETERRATVKTEPQNASNMTLKSTNEKVQIAVKTPKTKSSKSVAATPQGIKHLPPWQQEEYRILKRKLLEKQNIWNLNAKTSKSVDENGKIESSNLQPKETSKTPIQPKVEEVLKERSEQKQVQKEESWLESKEVTEMTILLDNIEKEVQEFKNFKDETARLRKEYSLMQNKMLKKKRLLILSKEVIENKDDLLKSKFSEYVKKKEKEEQKQSHRDSEMSTLRFKEISLRTQLVCFNLDKELKIEKATKRGKLAPSSPLKKPKNLLESDKKEEKSRENQKKVFSLADTDNLDPDMPLCPYDISGICNDEECKYQHIRKL